MALLFFIVALEGLQLARLRDAGKGIIVLEDALARTRLLPGEAGVETKERHCQVGCWNIRELSACAGHCTRSNS